MRPCIIMGRESVPQRLVPDRTLEAIRRGLARSVIVQCYFQGRMDCMQVLADAKNVLADDKPVEICTATGAYRQAKIDKI